MFPDLISKNWKILTLNPQVKQCKIKIEFWFTRVVSIVFSVCHHTLFISENRNISIALTICKQYLLLGSKNTKNNVQIEISGFTFQDNLNKCFPKKTWL